MLMFKDLASFSSAHGIRTSTSRESRIHYKWPIAWHCRVRRAKHLPRPVLLSDAHNANNGSGRLGDGRKTERVCRYTTLVNLIRSVHSVERAFRCDSIEVPMPRYLSPQSIFSSFALFADSPVISRQGSRIEFERFEIRMKTLGLIRLDDRTILCSSEKIW